MEQYSEESKCFSVNCFHDIFFCISQLNSEIKKRILKDGTIEYYTCEKIKEKLRKRVVFKSRFNKLIEKISSDEGVDPFLIKCIIKTESNFNPNAVSKAGAMGLMQIMQDVARCYNVIDPFDPGENIRAGIKHFKAVLTYFDNKIHLSLAAYNVGVGRVKKIMAVPSIKETIKYVDKVMLLYTGKKISNTKDKIKRLYKRIEKDGTLLIYDK